ncbi:uncharacterized protein LOC141702707 [Apium graveolens]|uniref:uncharacterized protein LOC141702707 n=1 Tax=Apium graveolens TaxID=4045 RepID=UPI003D7B583A
MCNIDGENMIHAFFDCNFDAQYWSHVNLSYDMRELKCAPDWLLSKLDMCSVEVIIRICTLLWGVWFWRNKRVWEGRVINPVLSMDGAFNSVSEWKKARHASNREVQVSRHQFKKQSSKWMPLEEGALKINVDASVFPGSSTFTMGLVIRDSQGTFVTGKNISFHAVDSVFEAEAIGVKEALSWIKARHLHHTNVLVKTNSLLAIQGINNMTMNWLERFSGGADCYFRICPGSLFILFGNKLIG